MVEEDSDDEFNLDLTGTVAVTETLEMQEQETEEEQRLETAKEAAKDIRIAEDVTPEMKDTNVETLMQPDLESTMEGDLSRLASPSPSPRPRRRRRVAAAARTKIEGYYKVGDL